MKSTNIKVPRELFERLADSTDFQGMIAAKQEAKDFLENEQERTTPLHQRLLFELNSESSSYKRWQTYHIATDFFTLMTPSGDVTQRIWNDNKNSVKDIANALRIANGSSE